MGRSTYSIWVWYYCVKRWVYRTFELGPTGWDGGGTMAVGFLATLSTQWKSVLALAGATVVGMSAGAYLTLPKAVASIAAEQVTQAERMEILSDLVIGNTRAIRLLVCTQSAGLIKDTQEREIILHACIATYGINTPRLIDQGRLIP